MHVVCHVWTAGLCGLQPSQNVTHEPCLHQPQGACAWRQQHLPALRLGSDPHTQRACMAYYLANS